MNHADVLKWIRDHGPTKISELEAKYGERVKEIIDEADGKGSNQHNISPWKQWKYTGSQMAISSLETIINDLTQVGFLEVKTSDEENNVTIELTLQYEHFRKCFGLSLSMLSLYGRLRLYGIGQRVRKALNELEDAEIPKEYSKDIEWGLWEISQTFEKGCMISALAQAGRLLEVCLRYRLDSKGIKYDDNIAVGGLLTTIKNNGCDDGLPATLKNYCNIINTYRISAVHKKKKTLDYPKFDEIAAIIYSAIHLVEYMFFKQQKG